ncbi:hypothetical protein [Nocardiopsis sp. MG754419]|uniref:hypothetical protein n=1 Tax=Nocardiopsis sp. MG754419 TaxID=2259865 RepID=UPI001BAAE6BC|nr:hypothetical protein [Nocardiopsis sp. MG754419]MBR8741950.1 hypothetical protein [Nocardiopsis sp. MG754419]
MHKDKLRIKTIGKVLTARRVDFDPARHDDRAGWLQKVQETTDLGARDITDLESGVRYNYGEDTVTALERVYRLRPGTLGPALQGEGGLVSDDGELLVDPLAAPEPVEEQLLRFTAALRASVEHLPEQEAAHVMTHALASAEARAFFVIDTKPGSRRRAS